MAYAECHIPRNNHANNRNDTEAANEKITARPSKFNLEPLLMRGLLKYSIPNAKMIVMATLWARRSCSFQTTKCGRDQIARSIAIPQATLQISKVFSGVPEQ